MHHKTEQLEAELKRQIGRIISQGLADPRVRGIISVTDVSVTADRHTAVVSVSIMPEEHEKSSLQGLRHARRYFQAELARRIRIRQVPHLDFKLDKSLKKQAQVYRAINEAMAQTGPAREDPDENGDRSDENGPATQESHP